VFQRRVDLDQAHLTLDKFLVREVGDLDDIDELVELLMICSRIRSSPVVTMVICEIEGSRVGPIEMVSMLKPRPLNSPIPVTARRICFPPELR